MSRGHHDPLLIFAGQASRGMSSDGPEFGIPQRDTPPPDGTPHGPSGLAVDTVDMSTGPCSPTPTGSLIAVEIAMTDHTNEHGRRVVGVNGSRYSVVIPREPATSA
jgi:hypothetical protein